MVTHAQFSCPRIFHKSFEGILSTQLLFYSSFRTKSLSYNHSRYVGHYLKIPYKIEQIELICGCLLILKLTAVDVFQEFVEVAVYHGRNKLLICLMDGQRKASSVWKISPKVSASYGYGVWIEASLWLLNDLADELEAITANVGQKIKSCHAPSAFLLLTKTDFTTSRRKYVFTFL